MNKNSSIIEDGEAVRLVQSMGSPGGEPLKPLSKRKKPVLLQSVLRRGQIELRRSFSFSSLFAPVLLVNESAKSPLL